MKTKKILMTREKFEEQEKKILAPCAMKSKETKGRKYPENEHPFRSVYQRDRDRIIHSTAFRRLEYKTQVFGNLEGDYYRTRLTHTNEVAQIARSIARTLGLNEDLTEAIALAHDIGHTPFGHSGEDVLNEIMEDEGGFEHNFQSIRVLDELEEKYPDFPGLNLSWETREGIVKHTTDYDNPKIKDFDPGIPPTLEAQIVNVADEIAYNSHDVDDGVTSRILTIDGLKQTLIWNEIKKHMDMDKFNHLSFEMKKYHMTRALINTQVTALVENTVKNLEENKISSVGDVRNYGQLIIKFDDDMEKMHRDFKDFLYKNFYKHHKVIRMEYKAGKIIKDLFDIYYMRGDRKDSRGVQTSILPPEIAKRLKNDSLKRVICDYIAAMTDRSILDEYHKLFDPYEKV